MQNCQEQSGPETDRLVVRVQSCSDPSVIGRHRPNFCLNCRPLTLVLTLFSIAVMSSCGPSPVIDLLEVRTSGQNKESFEWKLNDSQARGKHQVFVGLENDPAKLMGWSSGARTYRAIVKLSLDGPDGASQEASLFVPITELKPAGESVSGQTEFLAPQVSGLPQPNGMYFTEPVWAFSFPASAGAWTLKATLMAPPNSDRRGLQVVRGLRIETRSRADGETQLTGWKRSGDPASKSQTP